MGWSPPPESNRRPHPYHRCAGGSRRYAPPRITTQPRRWEGASKSGNVGQREDACSAVSGKFLARAPAQSSWHQRRRHRPDSPRPQATGTSGALLSSDDYGSSVEPAAKLHPLWQGARRDRHKLEQARSVFDQGSFRSCGRFTVGCVALELVGGGVANDYFLVHASSPVSEALIRTAGRLAPSRGSCHSGVGAA